MMKQIDTYGQVLREVIGNSKGSRRGHALLHFNFGRSPAAVFEGHAAPESAFTMAVTETSVQSMRLIHGCKESSRLFHVMRFLYKSRHDRIPKVHASQRIIEISG